MKKKKVQQNLSIKLSFKGKTVSKAFIFYFTFISVVIYLLTTIQMSYSRQKLQEKIYDTHISALNSMQIWADSGIVEKVNTILLGFQTDMVGSVSVRNFVHSQKKLTEGEIYNTYTELVRLKLENPVIYSIEIYNKNSDLLISSYSGATYIKDAAQYQDYFYNEQPMWTKADDEYIEVINTFPLYVAGDKKSVCSKVILNQNTIKRLIAGQSDKGNEVDFYICDNNFRIISGTKKTEIEFDAEKLRTDRRTEISHGTEKYEILSVESAYGDWNYVYTVPFSMYMKEIKELNNVSFWNVLSMLLLSFFGIVIITLWFYKPITEAVNMLKKHFAGEQAEPDISYINEKLKHLIRQVNDINATVKENEPLLASHLVMETVYGNIDSKEFSKRLEALDISFEFGSIIPVALDIDEDFINLMDAKQQCFTLYTVSEMLSASFSADIRGLSTKISYNKIMLFVLGKPENLKNILKNVMTNIELFGVKKANFIIGKQAVTAEELGINSREAMELSKYSFVFGYSNVLEAQQLSEMEKNNGIPVRDAMQLLDELLERSDFKGAISFINTLYDECIKNRYSCECIQDYFFEALKLSARTSKKYRLDDVKMSAEALSELQSVYKYILCLFEKISVYTDKPSESHEELMVSRIKEYILNNIEGDVSQGMIAEKFDVSTAHISRLFKKCTGIKFSDYVTASKLSHAARLLKENPDLKITEVAERLGYYNMHYFNTLFKKQYFLTPSQYRKQQ